MGGQGLQGAQHVLRDKLGREPSDDEVAQIASLNVELVRSIRALSQPTYSFDEPVSGRRGDPSRLTLADVIAVEPVDDAPSGAPSLEDESRRAALDRAMDVLSPRERQVLELVATGKLNKQIAVELGAAEKTIKVHRGRIMEKMQVRTAAALVGLLSRAAPRAQAPGSLHLS